MTTTVLLAGATGMLGNRIATHLLTQPAVSVRLLVRPSAHHDPAKTQALDALVVGGGRRRRRRRYRPGVVGRGHRRG